MSAPDALLHLTAGGITLRMPNGSSGVYLDTLPGDDWLDGVAMLANEWARGDLPDLLARIERGEDVMAYAVYARRADQPFEALRARWRERTGEDPGEDAMIVGSPPLGTAALLPRRALVAILREFERQRAEVPPRMWGPPAPVLFTAPSTGDEPQPGEEGWLRRLEEQALVNDMLASRVDVLYMGFIVERRQLVARLAERGLLDATRAELKRRWLVTWALPKLLGWFDAACARVAYLASPERAAYELPPPPVDPLASAVSLDWFRLPTPPPEGVAPHDWLALCERVLFVNPPDTPRASGEILSRIRNKWYRIIWRRDDGRTPVVLRAQPM